MVGERKAFGLLPQTACLFLVLKFSSNGLNTPSSQGEIGVLQRLLSRFNEVPADVYKDYTISLAYDLAQTK